MAVVSVSAGGSGDLRANVHERQVVHEVKLDDADRGDGRAEALLKAMLTSGESANYFQKAQEVCGFTPIEELTEQAKN